MFQLDRAQLNQPRERAWYAGAAVWLFVPCFLLLHGFAATCLPGWLDPLSTFFIVIAEWAAIAASAKAARFADWATRILWMLLIGAILIHSAAMSLDGVQEIARTPMVNHTPAFSIVLSMLYSVPLLAAVSIQSDRRILPIARVIHAVLSMTIGGLIYLEILSFIPLQGSANPADAILITNLFDGMDVFLAVGATIRWLGSTREQERGFFHILMIFMWIDTVLPAIHNRLLMRHDWVWLDLLISAPYAVLVPLIVTHQDRKVGYSPSGFVRVVRSGSPILLAGTLICIGVIAAHRHVYVGLAAALLGVAGYGTLNIFVQSRGLEAEESLLASNAALEKLVGLDGLTGIANRRAFDEMLQREFFLTIRTMQPVSLLMIDVDFFKDLNDAKGHIAGDEYLVCVAGALDRTLARTTDFVARYGGEEFSVILPATDQSGAMVTAEKLRKAVADLNLEHPTSPEGVLTVSIGVSTFDGSLTYTPGDLTKAADGALYLAKRGGRNRSVLRQIEKSRDVVPVSARS